MPTVDAIGTAVPSTRIPQEKLRELARGLFVESDPLLARVLAVFDNARIEERAFAMPLEWYYEPHGFKDRSAAFAAIGLELMERAARDALDRAGLRPADVDGIVFATTTGIATPSLDARLANALALAPSALRLPIWGLGCSGGVGGLNRTADLARAHPGKRFLFVALELCSLAFDLRRLDKKTLVASSLFADGCAAVVVSGDEARRDDAGPRHVAGASHLFPGTPRVMGWDVEDHTLDVVFSTEIPDLVAAHSGPVARPFLAGHGVERPDHYVFHPGGAKVLDAYDASFGLPPEALARSRKALREHGNMSSATVLFALQDALAEGAPAAGETALLASLGPGFAMDLADPPGLTVEALLVAVLALLAAQRLVELALARRNVRALVARGGRLVPDDLYAPIVVLHVAFFAAVLVEGAWSPLAGVGPWTAPALVLFLAAQALRYWAILSLGDRWTTRLYVVPGEASVARGPYRYLRHPNYAGVALELVALPLAFGCFATAVAASAANAVLLARRVRVEERALTEASAEATA